MLTTQSFTGTLSASFRKSFLIGILALSFTSCNDSDLVTSSTESVNASDALVFQVDHQGQTWKREWGLYVYDAVFDLAPELLKNKNIGGMSQVCPKYNFATDEQKASFWALFFASIAYPESSFNPNTVYHEPYPLNKPSEGLLQLSADDGAHGDACDFKGNKELNLRSPKDNLRCGVLVMKNQIKVRKHLFPTSFYYWSVLTLSRGKAKMMKVYNENKARLGFCR